MRRIVLAAGAALMACGAASATTITTSTQFGPAYTDYNGAGTGASQLNLFDTSLGTLNSVSITATYGFTSNITVTNSDQIRSSGSVRTESTANFRSTSSAIDSVLQAQLDQAGPVSIGITTLDPAAFDIYGRNISYSLSPGSAQQLVSIGTTQSFGTGALTDAMTLSAFSSVGANNFTSQLMTVTGTLLSNSGGQTGAEQQTTATGTLQISYNYTPAAVTATVPEPASWAMMIAGFGMIGGAMRRRRVVVSFA